MEHVYLTLPKQISSTRAGSIFILSLTCFRSEYTIKSSGVSFMPPFLPFVNGVLMAIVMTISSGFFAVLLGNTMSVLVLKRSTQDSLHGGQSGLPTGQMGDDRAESLCSHCVRAESNVFLKGRR
jgi:hypothetical protein